MCMNSRNGACLAWLCFVGFLVPLYLHGLPYFGSFYMVALSYCCIPHRSSEERAAVSISLAHDTKINSLKVSHMTVALQTLEQEQPYLESELNAMMPIVQAALQAKAEARGAGAGSVPGAGKSGKPAAAPAAAGGKKPAAAPAPVAGMCCEHRCVTPYRC